MSAMSDIGITRSRFKGVIAITSPDINRFLLLFKPLLIIQGQLLKRAR
jgi:hypothetical protein